MLERGSGEGAQDSGRLCTGKMQRAPGAAEGAAQRKALRAKGGLQGAPTWGPHPCTVLSYNDQAWSVGPRRGAAMTPWFPCAPHGPLVLGEGTPCVRTQAALEEAHMVGGPGSCHSQGASPGRQMV